MKPSTQITFRTGRLSLRFRARTAAMCALLAALAVGLMFALLATGSLKISAGDIAASLLSPGTDPAVDRIILRLRLPRVLTALLVGASLGMAGAIFQSVSRNALGSPDVIGFTTGAATGAIVQIILFDAGPAETALAAVLSGMATAALVFVLSMRGRRTGSYRLVLTGIGFGAMLSGVNTVLLVMGDLDQAASAQLWLAGSLSTRTWAHVLPAAAGLALAAPLTLIHARRLCLLEMGDDTASQLGLSTERVRLTMVLAAVALTAIATAAAGPIAFIALAAPQLVRRLSRAPEVPVFSAALMGMVLLMAADLLSQRLPVEINMPIGLTTGLLGGFYLLWLLSRSRTV